jgi:hypothetical protein
MKSIQLTGKYGTKATGKIVIVDDEDYVYLNQSLWSCTTNNERLFYAVRSRKNSEGGCKLSHIKMHRLILGITDPKVFIDHIDGNGLNNQRSNLRIVSNRQNMMNKSANTNTTSKYKGVSKPSRHNFGKPWRASCKGIDKRYYKDCSTEIEAALQYNEWAKELHGEFAKLNIIE